MATLGATHPGNTRHSVLLLRILILGPFLTTRMCALSAGRMLTVGRLQDAFGGLGRS